MVIERLDEGYCKCGVRSEYVKAVLKEALEGLLSSFRQHK